MPSPNAGPNGSYPQLAPRNLPFRIVERSRRKPPVRNQQGSAIGRPRFPRSVAPGTGQALPKVL